MSPERRMHRIAIRAIIIEHRKWTRWTLPFGSLSTIQLDRGRDTELHNVLFRNVKVDNNVRMYWLSRWWIQENWTLCFPWKCVWLILQCQRCRFHIPLDIGRDENPESSAPVEDRNFHFVLKKCSSTAELLFLRKHGMDSFPHGIHHFGMDLPKSGYFIRCSWKRRESGVNPSDESSGSGFGIDNSLWLGWIVRCYCSIICWSPGRTTFQLTEITFIGYDWIKANLVMN
jgi:hypothetical protein